MCEFREKEENSSERPQESTQHTSENGVKEITQHTKSRSDKSIEEALTETKFGKFNYFLITIAGLILTNVLLETLGISFVHPVAQCDLKLTTQDKGLLSAIGFAGIITSSHLWGFLADTTGRKRVIQPTLFAGFALTVLSSFQNNFWVFLVLRYLNGIFVSGGSATVYAYLGEFHTSKTRSRAIMGASVIFGLGCMLLPAIAWLVINQDWSFHIPIIDVTYKPWRLYLVVCGIPGLFSAFCLFKIPESPKFVLSQNRQEEALSILRRVYAINSGKSENDYKIVSVVNDSEDMISLKQHSSVSNPVTSLLRSMWRQTAPLFQKPHLNKTIIACALQFGIFGTSNGMYMWFPDILNQMSIFMNENPGNRTTICQVVYSNYGPTSSTNQTEMPTECNEKLDIAAYEQSLFLEILYAVGFAVIGFIINAVGKISILFVVLAGCGACGVAAVLIDIPIAAIYLYLLLLLCGLSVTVVNAATVDLFPTNLRAMAVCISLMMGRLGSVVGVNVVGILLDNNCEAAFLSSGISLILCGVLAFFIPKPSKGLNKSRRVSLTSMTGN